MGGHRRAVLVGALFASLVSAACTSGDAATGGSSTVAPGGPASTTTEQVTTTAAPIPIAPLTGLPVDDEGRRRLARPALAVKIDNSREAMPQEGLNQADLVFEIKVEGISRLMAVYHSTDAGEIGPTRSARYSDPPLLALLGTPLFGWSGANEGVMESLDNSSWVVNVGWEEVEPTDYFRKKGRTAPHNLFTSTEKLFAYARADQGTPLQPFAFAGPGQGNASAAPIAGMSLSVGDTPSSWAWDAATGSWLRWQYGRRHETLAGDQASATNVVIMEIRYTGPSRQPIAKSEGMGRVRVLTGGNVVEGSWSRPSQIEPITLTADDGSPILLTPGRTWVELTPGSTAEPLDLEAAGELLSGR